MTTAAAGGARRGIVRCGIAALLFGASTPLAAEVADDVGSLTLAGLLYVGAAASVAPWVLPALIRGRVRRPRLSGAWWRRDAGRLVVAVVLGGAVGPVLLMAGLDRTPAATASLLLNLELVATVVLAALVFREHVGARVAVGTALVVAASTTLAWSAAPELRLGALLVAAACLCWGVDNCVTAGLDQVAPAQITLAKGLVAGGANLALGLASTSAPSAGATLAALAIGAVGYGASITLWVAGARDLGAARGQLVFATAPFLGAAVAWAALAEPATGRQLVALALAAVGVACVLGTDHDHEHRHEPVEHDHEHRHDDGHHDHEHDHDHDHGDHLHADPVDGDRAGNGRTGHRHHAEGRSGSRPQGVRPQDDRRRDDRVRAQLHPHHPQGNPQTAQAPPLHPQLSPADPQDFPSSPQDTGAEPGRHRHRHRHGPRTHAHPHVPDLHHRHDHP